MTAEAKIRQVGDNQVANFSLATSREWKDKSGEKQSESAFHNITVWGKLAGVVEKYTRKGSKLYVQGHLKYSDYEDENGVKKYRTEIVCESLQLLDKKPADSNGGSSDVDQ